ncbi:T9SS-dependent choice-of-anchor J family protein [Chryseobacterium sp. SLBN-27]|uniref:T9SS-dependent choice-of-anchor J family protein n=1 Tax=Chryseobacterium sp. SLBN-27 TaxID=3042287 RepID=UPI00286A797C|nr:choice-of-anchor J domain-containing protein [Chryseobacterium sp. SLBN-27]
MKKLLFFILMLPMLGFGQWTENFDSGTTMPAGWAVINNGGSNGWVFGAPGDLLPHSGSNVASISYNLTAHDDYLITKAIAVTAGVSDRISFYVKSRSSFFSENYEVLLSTTNQAQASFTTTIKALAKAPAVWTQLTFDLSAYNGQTVYVAVHATDTNQWELYADTFVVDALPTVPPSCTTLSSPANGASGVSTTPTFTWATSTNASSYLINLGTTPGGTDVMAGVDVGNVTTYTLPSVSALMYNKTYYVTVIPKNNNGNATGCTESSFTTITIPCPTVNSPGTSATGVSTLPTFTWSSVIGATGYKITLGTTSGGTDILNNVDLGNVTSYSYNGTALNPNTTYYYTITSYDAINSSTGCTVRSFTTTSAALPANDNCSGAVSLTVNSDLACGVTTPGNTLGASQSLAATPCFGAPDDDVWYSFVATASSHVVALSNVVSTGTSSTTDMYFQVLSGACGSLTSVLCSDPNSATVSGLTPGQTYYIRVYTYSGAGYNASFNICVGTPPPPPANDECSGAVALIVNPDTNCSSVTAGNTLGATTSMSATPCFGNPDDDVWYSFVATASSHVVTLSNVVSTGTTSTTDMYFQVLSGACGSLTSVLCSDPNSATVSGLTPGQTYYIRVYTYSGTGYNASFNICVGTPSPPPPPPPANDNCATPTALTVGADFASSAITTTNAGATADGTAQSCQTNATNNVWYSVVVPASGNLKIETGSVSGSTYTDSVVNVFSGSCGSLTPVACDDDSSLDGNFSLVSLTGQTPGATLLVSVWRFSTGLGTDGQFKIAAYDTTVLAANEVKDSAKDTIKLYPNPFGEVLNISDASNVKNVLITDFAGRLVKTIANPGKELHLGELKQGMYLVTLEMKDGSKQTIKAIKK